MTPQRISQESAYGTRMRAQAIADKQTGKMPPDPIHYDLGVAKQRAVKLAKAGASTGHIARQLATPEATIKQWLHEHRTGADQ